jgi:hypothetical protein
MRNVASVLWRGVQNFEHHGWVYVIANLLGVIIALPIVTLPWVLAGLSYLSHTAQTTPAAHIDELWIGLRKYWREGVIVGVLNTLFFGMTLFNFVSYLDVPGLGAVALRIVWFVMVLLWIAVQLYLWPLLEEMEHPNLMDGFRNAGVMITRHPGFSLLLALIILVFVMTSLALFAVWALVTPSMISCIGTTAVRDRLAAYRAAQHP